MNIPTYHSLCWVRELPTGLPRADPVQQDKHTPDTDDHQANLLTPAQGKDSYRRLAKPKSLKESL